jgi:hypothetical protein
MPWTAWQEIPGGMFAPLTPMTVAAGPSIYAPQPNNGYSGPNPALATTIFAVGEDGLVVSSTKQPNFYPSSAPPPQSAWSVVASAQNLPQRRR